VGNVGVQLTGVIVVHCGGRAATTVTTSDDVFFIVTSVLHLSIHNEQQQSSLSHEYEEFQLLQCRGSTPSTHY
jgi:hypothetical protein